MIFSINFILGQFLAKIKKKDKNQQMLLKSYYLFIDYNSNIISVPIE